MTSRIAPRSLIFKIAENHHGAHFYMWGQNSNNCNLYIVGKEILSGLMLSEELGSKNEHISSYISSHMHIFRKSCRCFGSQKTFIFAYLMSCPAESIGKLRYNILLHLQNSVHWAPVQFFLCPQVTVQYNDIFIGHHNESTEFQPNSTGFKLESGVNIKFEKIKTTLCDLRICLWSRW